MSRFNTTIDDNSPLITYSPVEAWTYGQPTDDPYFDRYANGTFTLTGTGSATARFTFYGTGVWIWGAKRPNHGMFTVTVDGQTSAPISGRRSDGISEVDVYGNQFNALLYRALSLSLGTHDVVLTNGGNQGSASEASFVDIDYITWETSIGPENSTLTTTTLDSSNFKLSGSGWRSAAENSTLGTLRGSYTTVPGDAVEIVFEVRIAQHSVDYVALTIGPFPDQGDAVEVYGSTGQTCGLFSVQIDGGISSLYNASTHKDFTNQLIFYGANLGAGEHTLRMTNSELSNGTLVIDHARAQRAVADPSSNPSSDAATGSKSGSSHQALIGGLCGAVAVLCILLIVLFIWMRRRRRVAIVSRKTEASRFEAFDIDQPALPPQVAMRQTSLSDLLRGSMMSRGTRSDVSRSSHRTGSSAESRSQSPKKMLTPVPFIIEQVDRSTEKSRSASAAPYPYSTRSTAHESSPMVASSSKLPFELVNGSASNSRLPHDVPGRTTPINQPATKPHGRRKKREGPPSSKTVKPIKKPKRPLPIVPRPSPTNGQVMQIVQVSPSILAISGSQQQPHRSTSMLKGRRRSVRNSRILRAGYNFFFAQPGSSNSGSAYAPTTVLTSEISERPTTTLSPVTEAPPPLPPSRSESPPPPRPLQLVNGTEKG